MITSNLYFILITQGKTSDALSKLLSLQAKDALLIVHDSNDSTITTEQRIHIALVQSGDLIKVLI